MGCRPKEQTVDVVGGDSRKPGSTQKACDRGDMTACADLGVKAAALYQRACDGGETHRG